MATFIKCKNDKEKLQTIKAYCEAQIGDCLGKIDWYNLEKSCSLDYADEIHDLKITAKRFEKILDIIEADEHTSILFL